jgi:hypothetical protein
MCFGNLKGDAPTGLDAEAKPARVSSLTTTEDNTPNSFSTPKQKSKAKSVTEFGTPTQSAKRLEEYERDLHISWEDEVLTKTG